MTNFSHEAIVVQLVVGNNMVYFGHYYFRNNSPCGSQTGSREVSPRVRSPFESAFNFPSSAADTMAAWSNASEEEPMGEEDQKFRVCILGHNGTGKTALVNQFLTSEYMNTYDASLGNNVVLLCSNWRV
jgi:hypothetical protein